MTFRSRCTVFGQSSRNDANELARPLSVAVSAGEPVPEALNAKRPRGPPASCVCSRMSRFLRHSPPNLTVCLLISLVSEPTTFQVFSERSHGWLAEKPSSGSPSRPADADLRDAAGELVDVRAGNADVLARRQAVARR